MVKVSSEDGFVTIEIDGLKVFKGAKEELSAVLKSHTQFMEYVDSIPCDGVTERKGSALTRQ